MASNQPSASCRPAPLLAPAHAVGTRIGHRYQVVELLGRGGMAVVYRVRDTSRGEEVALKQLNPQASARDRQLRAQFAREYYVLAQLSHPSVIAVYDFGVDSAGPYYTMELLDGGDLSAHAPMDYRAVCEVALQLCSSLSLLHSRNFVHRDVSPRNVRCTRQGSAKLIDFGAMVPMGRCEQIVGTPSFVAPEVVSHLALDARTDLFSLGATLYFALTGRKPFAAQLLSDLKEAWREQPAAPSQLVPGIPAALDALVLSLLRIDPDRRPRSAFEVIARLTAITGINRAEPEQIAEAYLSMPGLVGRELEQRRFRRCLRTTLQGDGGSSVFFEGEPGLGRTRLLDMCAIEAALGGATVLRVNGRAALRKSFAGAYAIAEQLLEKLPDLAGSCARTAQLEADLFVGVDHVATGMDAAPRLRPFADFEANLPRAQAALSKWLRAVGTEQPLVLALDDIERIDDASLAWIASSIRRTAGARVLLVATRQTSAECSTRPALHALREPAVYMELAPLSAAQTEALFASVFSNAPQVALVSTRVHRLAAGNLRESMALARHLLDQRIIRYAEGNWILPAELALSDLPASAEAAVRARVDKLPALARRIAETQALAFEGPWTRADYSQLAAADEERRVDDALLTLVRQGVLVENSNTYTLSHLGMRACLLAGLSDSEQAVRHLALAELCLHSQRPVIVEVNHRLLAGRVDEGLDRLATLLEGISSAAFLYETSGLERGTIAEILERGKALAAGRPRRARDVHTFNQRLIELSMTTDVNLYHRHANSWLAQLEHDSGLCDYGQTNPVDPPMERGQQVLRIAAARYAATAEHQRVYQPEEAVHLLSHFVTMSFTIALKTSDPRLFVGMPAKLAPFSGVSALIGALFRYAEALPQIFWTAQLEQARQLMLDVHARFERLTVRGCFEPTPSAATSSLAVVEVMLGSPTAERWIEIMERHPLQKLRSLNLRRVLCTFDGDMLGAERYRKQAELIAIQTKGLGLAPVPLFLDLLAQVHAGDLAGVKHVADRVEQLAIKASGWQALHQLAQGCFHRLRGDVRAAREAVEQALSLTDPTRTDPAPQLNVWVAAAAEYVTILTELNLAEEARAFGLTACEHCTTYKITGLSASLQRALALAEAKLGEYAGAASRLNTLIAQRAHIRPALLATDYEARARVALSAKDWTAAVRFVKLATRHLDAMPASPARHGRLLDEAKQAGLQLDVSMSYFESAVLGDEPSAPTADVSERLARLEWLAGPIERARGVLELMAEAAGASSGYLYYAQPKGLVCTATLNVSHDAWLDSFATGFVQQQRERAAMTTIFTEMEESADAGWATWTNRSGNIYRIALLLCERGEVCVGLIALCGMPAKGLSTEVRALSKALSARLLELGDVPRAK